MNDEIRKVFEEEIGISSFIKWSIDNNKYILTDDAIEKYHKHWVNVANTLLPIFSRGYSSRDKEIESLKCCGNCGRETDEVEECLNCPRSEYLNRGIPSDNWKKSG